MLRRNINSMFRTISALTCTVIQNFKVIEKRLNILNLEYTFKRSSSRSALHFTQNEEEKILNTINQSKDEELVRWVVTID